MASNPLFVIPDFFYIFQMKFAMATFGLKEMGKFLWAGWKKFCPVGCLSLDLLSQKFVWKMQKKVWYYEKWVGCHASFPPRTFAKG